MIDINQYARDCHALMIEKRVPAECQSYAEMLCARVVQLLGRVEQLERERETLRLNSLPRYVGGLDG